jgi:molybdenum cofactor guanylyltransferase
VITVPPRETEGTRDGAEEILRAERSTSRVEGAVLCGGASRRMGEDKALLRPSYLKGKSLLEHAIESLEVVAERVVLSCGEHPRYADLGRELVLDTVRGAGPLAGLVSALEGLRGEWLCVAACDMPRVGGKVFSGLLERARELDLDACLLETTAGLEPLCGVYRKSCAGPARRALDAGERRLVSFHGDGLSIGTLKVPDEVGEREGWALNLNTRAEYERELARESSKPTVRRRESP